MRFATDRFRKMIMWDVDDRVGLNQRSNVGGDVLLVQFGFHCMSLEGANIVDPQNKSIYAAVAMDDKCTGKADDKLVIAIKALELARKIPVDGYISPIDGAPMYRERRGFTEKMMFVLNHAMFDTLPKKRKSWPRIDHHPKCPARLKEFVEIYCFA